MTAPIPPKEIDLSTPEMKAAFGPLPKCKHGMIAGICGLCIELDKISAEKG